MAFTGFPQGTFHFLRNLGKNNNKAWFDDHRDDYDSHYIAPAKKFVEAIGPKLRKVSPQVLYEPRVNGSIFRINRDVRFSKDKRPYNDRLDFWFWHGDKRGWGNPGFFMRIAPESLILGAGMHQFDKPQLDAYRKAVVDRKSGKALTAAIDKVRAAGPYKVEGATRKTVPRGFEAEGRTARLLLHEGLWADTETGVSEAKSPRFVDFCVDHFAAMWPLGKWLLSELKET